MTQETNKLARILHVRMKFMRLDWESFNIDVLKTLVRIEFIGPEYEKGGKESIRDRHKEERALTPAFTIDDFIADQQRKLCRDIEQFVGKGYMDELREVLV